MKFSSDFLSVPPQHSETSPRCGEHLPFRLPEQEICLDSLIGSSDLTPVLERLISASPHKDASGSYRLSIVATENLSQILQISENPPEFLAPVQVYLRLGTQDTIRKFDFRLTGLFSETCKLFLDNSDREGLPLSAELVKKLKERVSEKQIAPMSEREFLALAQSRQQQAPLLAGCSFNSVSPFPVSDAAKAHATASLMHLDREIHAAREESLKRPKDTVTGLLSEFMIDGKLNAVALAHYVKDLLRLLSLKAQLAYVKWRVERLKISN